jgi:2'-5' RNA ligase/GNAT superfamily N-acetyltransferase
MSLLDKKTARQYDNASTQINVPPEIAAEITRIGKELIPDEHLAGDGRVEVIHVTIKYGVEPDQSTLQQTIAGYKSFEVSLGKTVVFPDAESEGVPVVIEVHGHEFDALHKAIAAAMGTLPDEFAYTPHITVAYVAQKEAQHYAGKDNFVGMKFVADAVTLSMFDDDNQVDVPLKTAASPSQVTPEIPEVTPQYQQEPEEEEEVQRDEPATEEKQEKRKPKLLQPKQPKQKAQPKPKKPPVETTNFKKWFGKSQVRDESGKPMVVYHGTTHDFEAFDPNTANPENHYGKALYFTSSKTDVAENYATESGPDLTSRIDNRSERIMQEWEDQWDDVKNDLGLGDIEEFPSYSEEGYGRVQERAKQEAKREVAGQSKGMTMPVYLSLQNPVVVQKRGGTQFQINIDEDGNESGNGLDMYNAMHLVGGNFNADVQGMWGALFENTDGDFNAWDFEKVVRGRDDVEDDEGNMAPGSFIAQVYQEMGFDGIIQSAYEAFGPQSLGPGYGQTKGMTMDEDTKHYILWDPTKIKSAIGNPGKFDPKNPSITAGNRSGTINQEFLATLSYRDFPQGDGGTAYAEDRDGRVVGSVTYRLTGVRWINIILTDVDAKILGNGVLYGLFKFLEKEYDPAHVVLSDKIRSRLARDSGIMSMTPGTPRRAAVTGKQVPLDELPGEVKADFVAEMAERLNKIGYRFPHDPDREIDEGDIQANFFGIVDEPTITVYDAPVEKLYKTFNRKPSEVAVAKYVEMLKSGMNFDPIFVNNGKFYDGGHRLEAYHQAGRKTIPVAEIGPYLNAPLEFWQRWFDNDPDTKIAAIGDDYHQYVGWLLPDGSFQPLLKGESHRQGAVRIGISTDPQNMTEAFDSGAVRVSGHQYTELEFKALTSSAISLLTDFILQSRQNAKGITFDWFQPRRREQEFRSVDDALMFLDNPLAVTASKAAAGVTGVGDLGLAKKIMHELMPVLGVQLPEPELKIVNSPRSNFLGRDIWPTRYVEKPFSLSWDDNTRVELQRSILNDENTLRRVIAHELCHHADFLVNGVEEAKKIHDLWSLKRFNSSDGHGAPWKQFAQKFNAKYGADFVTKKSDESYVTEDIELKPFHILLERSYDGTLGYEVSSRLSPKQKRYLDRLAQRQGKEGEYQNRIIMTSDRDWLNGPLIGSFYHARPKEPEKQKKLEELWAKGQAPQPTGAAKEQDEILNKMRQVPWLNQRKSSLLTKMADGGDEVVWEYAQAMKDPEKNKNYRQKWDVVPAARLKKIWTDYANLGFVRDEAGMRRIAGQVLDNIWKLQTNTILTGHTEESPSRYGSEILGQELPEDYFDQLESFFEDDRGSWRISDYGLDSLLGIAYKLEGEDNAEKQLQLVDRALQVTHPRSDLANWFVEGGSSALSQLFHGMPLTELEKGRKQGAAPQLEDLEQAVTDSRSTSLPQIQQLPHGVSKEYDRVRWVYQQFLDARVQSMSWQDFQKKFPKERNSPLFTKVRQNRPKITTEDMERWMDEFDAKAKEYQNYEIEHDTYKDKATSFRDVEQLVLKINQSASAREIIGEDPMLTEFLGQIAQGSQQSGHPVSANTVGWLRVDFIDDDWLLVDEVQSDLVNAMELGKKFVTEPTLESLMSGYKSDTVKQKIRDMGATEQSFQMSKRNMLSRGYTVEKLDEMKQQLINLFKDWAEYGIASLIEIARRHGIKNVAIHTGETIAKRDPDLEADKAIMYYDQLAKSFGFQKQMLDVGELKGNFWVRTASEKTAGKRDEAGSSMTVGTTDPNFPMPVLIRWEQGMRWRQVLKTVKAVVGEIAGHRVAWRDIHIWASLWANREEQEKGWAEQKTKGKYIMYDILHNGTFVSVGKPIAAPLGEGIIEASHKETPLSDTTFHNPEIGEETNAYADMEEKVEGDEEFPALETLAPQMFEKEGAKSLQAQLMALRPQMAQVAQGIYDDWDSGGYRSSEGGDIEFGEGGICDSIAREIGGIIASKIRDVEVTDGGQDGDDHAWTIAYRGKEVYGIDIPHTLYERGGGYSWTKVPGVTFSADDVEIFPLDVDPSEFAKEGAAEGVEYRIEVLDSHGGELFCEAEAWLNDKRIGVVSFNESEEHVELENTEYYREGQDEYGSKEWERIKELPRKIWIKNVEVKPEYRRQGIATGMYEKIKQEFPGEEITSSGTTPEGGKFREKLTERGVLARKSALLQKKGVYGEQQNQVQHTDHEAVGMTKTLKSDPFSEEMEALQKENIEPNPIIESGRIEEHPQAKGEDQLQQGTKMEKASAKFRKDKRDTVPGQVYLLHFDIKPGRKVPNEREDAKKPFHARHYLGWATDAQERIQQHYEGSGAKITQALKRKGITFTVARVWDGADRNFERRLKSQGGLSRHCPICHSLGLIPDSRYRKPSLEAVEAVPEEMQFGPDYVEKSAASVAAGNVQAALDEIDTIYPLNPLNQRENVVMQGTIPVAVVEVAERSGRLRLRGIRSMQQGKGGGSHALKEILAIADKHGVEVELTASPFGPEAERLDKDALQAWYRKHKFEDEPGYDPSLGYMVRQPKSAAGAVDIDWKRSMFEHFKLVPEFSWHEAGDDTSEDEEIGESNWNLMVVNAFDTTKKQKGQPGKWVGSADFVLRHGNLESANTEVDKSYWRQGIATAMYQYAEGFTGFKVTPHLTQSEAGRALWQQKDRPFGKNSAVDVRKIVEEGGGKYQGMMEHLVLFNSPVTDSTYAFPLDSITPEAVREQIEQGDAKFKKNGAQTVSGEDVVSYVAKLNEWDRDTAYQVVGLDAGGEYVLKDFPLSKLSAGDDYDPDQAEQYARMEGSFPPIVLGLASRAHRDKPIMVNYYVIRDGNHRVAAAKLRGDTKIKAYVPLDSTKEKK